MSKDLRLTHNCPHEAVEERVVLGVDRRSLSQRQSIAAGGSVILTANGIQIPRQGLYSQAELTSFYSGPYRIPTGETQLVVEGSTETLSVTLEASTRYTTDSLVSLLSSESTDLYFSNVNGHLNIVDGGSVGRESSIKVSGSSICALGFYEQYGARGKRIYPSWNVVKRTPDFSDELAYRYLRFDTVVKLNPIFLMSYSMGSSNCLRCQSTLKENDFRFEGSGNVILVDNENLLYQSCLKILLTTRGTNPFYPWYGTLLRSRIGTKATGLIVSAITEDVRRALERYKSLQQQQSNYQGLTFKEQLFQITRVQVQQHVQDPTIYLVDVVVTNASEEPVNVTVVFAAPQAVQQMGANGFLTSGNTLALR